LSDWYEAARRFKYRNRIVMYERMDQQWKRKKKFASVVEVKNLVNAKNRSEYVYN
jgi:hypothetical protein